MATPVIMDAIVVIILVVAAVSGARRGFLESLAGLVIVVLALAGAGVAAETLAEPVAGVVSPLVEARVTERLETALREQGDHFEWPTENWPETGGSVQEIFALLGLDEEVRTSLTERVQNAIQDTGATLASAVVRSLVRSFAYGVLFILAFISILLILKGVAGAIGLVLKLPGLRGLNALGGAAIGLIEGVLLLFLAVWVCRCLGVSFESAPLADAYILRIFTTHSPMGLLSFL